MKKAIGVGFILILLAISFKYFWYNQNVSQIKIVEAKVNIDNIEHLLKDEQKMVKYHLSSNQEFIIPEIDTLKIIEKQSNPDNQSEYTKYTEEEISENYTIKISKALVTLNNNQKKECLLKVTYQKKLVADFNVPVVNLKLNCIELTN